MIAVVGAVEGAAIAVDAEAPRSPRIPVWVILVEDQPLDLVP